MNSYSQIMPNANSTLPYSFKGENNSIFSKTERIPIKNKFQNSNFKKINKNLINSSDNNKFLDNFILKNSTISNKAVNKNKKFINEKSKTGRSRRTLSYGNLEVKTNKNNESYKMLLNKNNNNIFNNSNIINNTQSLKAIFPSYTITSPNGLFYPIIFTNNNENYVNNNNLNNNILFNYQGNNTINYNNKKKDNNPKPSLWYANIFSPINQIPIIQDNSYAMPKILNNSANFNSIQNFNVNKYSEEYLNKQIFDFINANTKTKQNIITNISKKHNINLDKSSGEIKIKINENNNKFNSNKLKKNMKNKNYYTMNIDESSKITTEKLNSEISDIVPKDKSFDKNKKLRYKSSVRNGRENKDKNNILIKKNNINSHKDLLLNKNNKSQNIKTNRKDNSYSYNAKNYNNKDKNNKKFIYNLKNNNKINLNKNINQKFSNEFNKRLLEKEKDYSKNIDKVINNDYSNNEQKCQNYNNNDFLGDSNNDQKYNNYNNNDYLNDSNNEKEINKHENYPNLGGYNINNMKNNNNSNIISLNINKNSNNYNYNNSKKNINNNQTNNINNKNKTNLIKKDKINFNIQNVSSEIFNQRINYIRNHNISISTLTSNDNNKKSLNPSQYEISNAVDEQFINQNNNKEENNEGQNISEEDSLGMSLQSMNDSKMLELANKYIDDGGVLDRSKINDILNDKSSQKFMKKNK